MSIQTPSTPAQAAMLRTWEAHLQAEFVAHDLEATMATMTAEPSVLHIGPMTGARGAAAMRRFYEEQFLHAHPPDTRSTLLSRVIGEDAIVDQLLHEFTHTIVMPWLLPGVAPTGRAVAFPLVAAIEFEGDKIASERIYFDQAAVLVQVGLLDTRGLPASGRAAADALAGS